MIDAGPFLRHLFDAAVAAADPMVCVPEALPPHPPGRVVVVGAGKASARMAEAVEASWGPCEGLVITRDGYARPCRGIEIVEASHPVPDARGLAATARILALLQSVGEDDAVLALISGGASALLVQPAGNITLCEKQAISAALLGSGAPIEAVNTVRKHLSLVKGGQLAAAAWPARVTSLIVSDVAGDDLAFIGSGPTVGDTTTPADAAEVLSRYAITPPASVAALLAGPSRVLAPGAPRLGRTENRLIAAPLHSLDVAAEIGRAAGCRVEMLGDAIEGEARAVAADHARLARSISEGLSESDPPVLVISGGECTVTRRGDGVGGPNAEFALALALALDARGGIHAIACDTDGIDGAAEVAGALIGPGTLWRAAALGLDAQSALAGNDSHTFFAATGEQVVTGPTLTNVNDFRAILIQPQFFT